MRNYLNKCIPYLAIAIITAGLFNSCKKESDISIPSNEGVAKINFKLSQSSFIIDTDESKYASTNKIEELASQSQQEIIPINDEYHIVAEFIDESKLNSKGKLASTNSRTETITNPINYVVYVFDKLSNAYVTSYEITNDSNGGNEIALPSDREYTFVFITDMMENSAIEVAGREIVTKYEIGFNDLNQDLSSAVYKGRRWFLDGRDYGLQGVRPSTPMYYCKIDNLGQLTANQTYTLPIVFKRLTAKVTINYQFLSTGLKGALWGGAVIVSPNLLLGNELDIFLNTGLVDINKHDPNFSLDPSTYFSPVLPGPLSWQGNLLEAPYVGHAYLKASDPNAKLKLNITTNGDPDVTLFEGELTKSINLQPGGDYTVNLKIQRTSQ